MDKLADVVKQIIKEIVLTTNIELVDVEYLKAGRSRLLRIFIDKKGGVTIGDCQLISKKVSQELDLKNLIPYKYRVEVSSPGLNRVLKKDEDFKHFMGRLVKITTYSQYSGKNAFVGYLKAYNKGEMVIELKGCRKLFKIPISEIAKARLEIDNVFG
ncbi:MAG: ribosome maturation factor RimP [bacterium]|nr:ribosome maturation factor RimP [bacterium]